jgi:glycosyltransferase involved in cell wall biosynthesis
MKTKINILVDCHVFDGKPQGTTTYLKGLYSELIKDSSINFYFVALDIENLKNIFGNQSNVFYIQLKSKSKIKRLLIVYPLIVKKYKIDFAHFQYIVPPIKLCKYIVTIHDVLFLDYPEYFPLIYKIKNRVLFQISSWISDFNLTVSKYSEIQIRKHFKVKNVYITPNAVSDIYFEPFDKSKTEKEVYEKFGFENFLLFVSRREPRKNHLTLLKTFVTYKYFENFQLVFIGNLDIFDATYEDYYSSLDNNIKEKIVIIEKINDQDLLLVTRAAKVSIYPSFAEGFGIPPLEAIACGTSTICSNATAMSDFSFIKEYLFEPNSIEDLNIKLQKALNSKLEKNVIEEMKSKYSWKKSAEVIQKLIKNKV